MTFFEEALQAREEEERQALERAGVDTGDQFGLADAIRMSNTIPIGDVGGPFGAIGGLVVQQGAPIFMSMLHWLTVPGRLAVQGVSALEQTKQNAIRGEFQLEAPQFDANVSNPEDATRALQLAAETGGPVILDIPGFRIRPAQLIPTVGVLSTFGDLGLKLPESPEEAADSLRQASAVLSATSQAAPSPALRFAGETLSQTLPWFSGLFNRMTFAETLFDPLNLLDGFGVGSRIANGLRRAVDAAETIEPLARFIKPTRQVVRNLTGASTSEVHRTAQVFNRQATAKSAGIEEAIRGNRANLESIIGATMDGDVAANVNDIISKIGVGIEQLPTVARAGRTAPLQRSLRIQEWLGTKFADVPEPVRRAMSDTVIEATRGFDNARAWELLNDIPTPMLLDDLQYAPHILTSPARRAMSLSVGAKTVFKNDLGGMLNRQITQSLKRRDLRQSLEFLNEKSGKGELAWLNGQLVGATEKNIAKGATKFEGKLFSDDPFALSYIRQDRAVRSVSSAQFFRHVSRDGSEFLTEAGKEGVQLEQLFRGGRSSKEWQNTFGRLADNNPIRQLAEGAAFKNTETAQAVLRYSNLMRNIGKRPGLAMRYYDSVLRMWRGLTLSPFMPYHARNFVGNIVNNDLAGIMPHDYIDSLWHMSKGTDMYQEAQAMGVLWTGEVRGAIYDNLDFARNAPFEITPAGSKWHYLNPGNRDFIGAQVGSAIENHARFTHYLAKRKQGLSPIDALESVNKFLFDYTDIPPWQRSIKRAMAFPTWTFKNIPLQFEMLFKRPNKFALRGRFIEASAQAAGVEGPTPEFIREGGGFPLPSVDPNKTLFLRPENFDPAFSLNEVLPENLSLLGQGGVAQTLWDFGYEMLNPFVTELPEQLGLTVPVRASFGGPVTREPTFVFSDAPEAERTGYDTFFGRAIRRPNQQWNPLAESILGEIGVQVPPTIPPELQSADHFLRSFFRFYSEGTALLKNMQQSQEGKAGTAEVLARRFAGIPVFEQDPDKVLHFHLRDLDRAIASEQEREDPSVGALKNLYTQKLAVLGLGSFAAIDPFTGDTRNFMTLPSEERENSTFNLTGKSSFYRDAEKTCWMLLLGAEGPTSEQKIPDIPLSDSEVDAIEGLLDRILDTYMIEVSNAFRFGELTELQAESRVREARQRQARIGVEQ